MSRVLHDFDAEFITAFVPAVRKDDVFAVRSIGSYAIFCKKFQNIVSILIKFSDRIMGPKLRIDGYLCLI